MLYEVITRDIAPRRAAIRIEAQEAARSRTADDELFHGADVPDQRFPGLPVPVAVEVGEDDPAILPGKLARNNFV